MKQVCIMVAVLVVFAALVFLFFKPRRADISPKPAEHNSTGTATVISQPSVNASHAFTSTNSKIQQSEVPPTAVASAAYAILHTEVGRITATQAEKLIDDFVHSTQLDATVQPLLSSEEPHQRVLAVYALLEAHGLTEQLRAIALDDPSPYVRAEVVAWLLARGFTKDAEQIITAKGASMNSVAFQELMNQALRAPSLDVPVAMHRLRLGMALPIYFKGVAAHTPNAAATIEESLYNPVLSHSAKALLLQTIADLQEPDYRKSLQRLIETSGDLATRTIAARSLAAIESENNADIHNLLQSAFAKSNNGTDRPAFRFAEAWKNDRINLEKSILEATSVTKADPMRIYSLAEQYLGVLGVLGTPAASVEAAQSIMKGLSTYRHGIPYQLLYQYGYIIASLTNHQKSE